MLHRLVEGVPPNHNPIREVGGAFPGDDQAGHHSSLPSTSRYIRQNLAAGAGLGGGHDEREQTLNQLLVEMDGFESKEGVIIMAATNRPDVLDPALLRAGRFDRRVFVPRPDLKGREEILKVHTRRTVLSPNVNLSVIARGTPGFSGADL